MSVRDRVERVVAADHRAQFIASEHPEQVGHSLGEHRGMLHDVHQPEADNGGAAGHQHPDRDVVRRHTPGHAEHGEPTEWGESAQAGIEYWTARHLQNHVDAAAAVGVAEGGREVGYAGIDRDIRAEFDGDGAFLGAGCGRNHASCAPFLRELDGDGADPARPGVHDDRLAGRQMCAGAEQVPGGRTLHERGERVAVVHHVGDGKEVPRVHRDAFGVAAARDHAQQPVAVCAAHHDLAARDEWQGLPGKVRVLGLVGVGVVDASRQNLEHLFAVASYGIGSFADDEFLGTAELGEVDSSHTATLLAERGQPLVESLHSDGGPGRQC